MKLQLPGPPRALVRATLAARAALVRAADALIPPEYAIFDLSTGVLRTQLLHAAARLRIADLLEDGPQDAAALARRTGSDPDALHRALRALASAGVFALGADRRFSNNRLSRALLAGRHGSMRDFVEYLGFASNLRAFAGVDATLADGKNAFERENGAHVWDWFAAHPEEGRSFAAAMSHATELDAPSLAAGYDFGRFARICDLAGGRGTLLAEVLRRHPGPRGVLFDAAWVLEEARPYLASRGVAGRVELVAGDLFGDLPAGADAYLMKDVLHDWDDATCGRILAGCRRAMRPGARLLVVEVLVHSAESDPPAPILDVLMMLVCREGRQRSRDDLRRLLARAGLRLEAVHALASPFSIVEAIAG